MTVEYLILFAIVFGVNLMPAFGPPTWTIIVLYGLNSSLPVPIIVILGALAAASGRFTLANGFRLLAHHVSQKAKANLNAAREALERNRRSGFIGLGLFALSPLPSAQLFEAAGLTGVRLLPFTLAFFAGRLVAYAIYAGSAKAVEGLTLGDTFKETLTSPVGIAIQVAMLVALVVLVKVDWAKLLAKEARD
uniref:hypothetical protein n=1 Tax=Altererythrobacter segetis TaxID=1104773 RepID=UPI00140731F5|nr:hypothetical protein [Altererythrobacter segetis]